MENIRNSTKLIGRVTRLFDIKQSDAQKAAGIVARGLVLAVDDNFQSTMADGSKDYATQFVTLNVVRPEDKMGPWGDLTAGQLIAVSAHLRGSRPTGKNDADGNPTYYPMQLIADSMAYLEPKSTVDARNARKMADMEAELNAMKAELEAAKAPKAKKGHKVPAAEAIPTV